MDLPSPKAETQTVKRKRPGSADTLRGRTRRVDSMSDSHDAPAGASTKEGGQLRHLRLINGDGGRRELETESLERFKGAVLDAIEILLGLGFIEEVEHMLDALEAA